MALLNHRITPAFCLILMSKQRLIKTSFWDEDEWVQTLNSNETLLYLYLLTGPKTSLCGIFKVLISHVKLATKLTSEQIESALKRFEKEGKIIVKDHWIILLNRSKHQNPSPKISRGIERELLEIPHEVTKLMYPIDTVSIQNGTPKVKVKVESKSKVKVNNIKKVFDQQSDEWKLSDLLFNLIIKNNPYHKFKDYSEPERELQKQSFSTVADLMFRVDKRDVKFSEFLVEWCQNSDFWRAIILSMNNFRDKYDQLAAQAKRAYEEEKKEKKPKYLFPVEVNQTQP